MDSQAVCRAEVRASRVRAPLLAALVAVVASLAGGCGDSVSEEERERAIAAAQRVYAEERAKGRDFSNGPCIAEEVIDDWAVDIAHSPRQPVDDKPENQCESYREGRVHHFVELDPDGNLIRAK